MFLISGGEVGVYKSARLHVGLPEWTLGPIHSLTHRSHLFLFILG
jgi:hypothetical protein